MEPTLKRFAIVFLVVLAGCGTPVREDANCSFWETMPYNGSQIAWRQFDCPYEHQRDIRLGIDN